MAHYIDKDALVAEIERRKQVAFGWMETAPNDAIEAEFELCDDILSFINTLESKEVDLEEEINRWQGCEAFPEGVNITPLPKAMDIVERTAKYFFELGLKAQKGE